MRAIAILALFTIAGCASGGSAPTGQESVRSVGGLRLRNSDEAKEAKVNYPIARAWPALIAAYDSLGIPLTEVDEKGYSLGNAGMRAFKTLAGVPLSKYLNCGSTQGFASADSYQIQMAVQTQADSTSPRGISLYTLLQATARPITVGGNPVRCSTTGQLEARIAERVRQTLGS